MAWYAQTDIELTFPKSVSWMEAEAQTVSAAKAIMEGRAFDRIAIDAAKNTISGYFHYRAGEGSNCAAEWFATIIREHAPEATINIGFDLEAAFSLPYEWHTFKPEDAVVGYAEA